MKGWVNICVAVSGESILFLSRLFSSPSSFQANISHFQAHLHFILAKKLFLHVKLSCLEALWDQSVAPFPTLHLKSKLCLISFPAFDKFKLLQTATEPFAFLFTAILDYNRLLSCAWMDITECGMNVMNERWMNVTKMLQNKLKLFHMIEELKGALLKKIGFFFYSWIFLLFSCRQI